MSIAIHLLGRPRVDRTTGEPYRFRSNKSWAVLAYLILAGRAPSRSQLASMLFAEAQDPARALRWCLAEIRRGLGDEGTVDGDPVRVDLSPTVLVDARTVTGGRWPDAIDLPGLGAELLEGMGFRGAPGFETWLVAAQRRVAAASEHVLHEAALAASARHRWTEAIDRAARVTAMNPLDENYQALLIRLYRLAGDHDAAARQFAACVTLFERELGSSPGSAVQAALRVDAANVAGGRARDTRSVPTTTDPGILAQALLESGSAAIGAGAIELGVRTLQEARDAADAAGSGLIRVQVRLELAEALVHSVRGRDEEGLALLWEADEIAGANGLRHQVAQARAERGYVDFLRARYDRAELGLADALRLAEGSTATQAKAATYLGCVASDRADHPRATVLLRDGIDFARAAGDLRREVYALSMLGRVCLLDGDLDAAAALLDESRSLAERDRWLAFLPWPQALRAEVQLARGDVAGADRLLRPAFVHACRLADPCWEGTAARGLALVAAAEGDTERAFDLLADARRRADRVPDSYVWLDGYILHAQCELAVRHGHPQTGRWVDELQELAARTGMVGFLRHALRYGAAIGRRGDDDAVSLFETGRSADTSGKMSG